MKKPFISLIIISISLLKVNAQEILEKDNTLIDDFIKSKISIEKEIIDSDTLAKVFNGTFFKVGAGYSLGSGVCMCDGNLFVIKDGALSVIESSNIMNSLIPLLQNDFYLKSETDAKIFETALDKLYPMSETEIENKEHLKKNNQWYFIRGKFFDSKSGYIIDVDQNSKITNINYSMEAIKQ